MTAEPIPDDPQDPRVILRDLPARERGEFLRQYREAVDAAHEPAGYQDLQRLLHTWSLAVIAANRPGYYEALERARNRDDLPDIYTPIAAIVPDWTDRVAAARHASL